MLPSDKNVDVNVKNVNGNVRMNIINLVCLGITVFHTIYQTLSVYMAVRYLLLFLTHL